MATEKFERSKPHVNIGTIGHVDHGKTTLSAAILKISRLRGFKSSDKGVDQIDASPEEKSRGVTISITHLECETPKRHYALMSQSLFSKVQHIFNIATLTSIFKI